jgi:hypothetical protein
MAIQSLSKFQSLWSIFTDKVKTFWKEYHLKWKKVSPNSVKTIVVEIIQLNKAPFIAIRMEEFKTTVITPFIIQIMLFPVFYMFNFHLCIQGMPLHSPIQYSSASARISKGQGYQGFSRKRAGSIFGQKGQFASHKN